MIENKLIQPENRLQIENDYMILTTSTVGAEIQSLKIKSTQTEVFWQGDPLVWSRRAPWLFPIVGRVKNDEYFVGSKAYLLKQHGFARDLEFELMHKENNILTFQLSSSKETLQVYPFKFKLTITYKLVDELLQISANLLNEDNQNMIAFLGFHPGFNLFGSSWVQFEKNEDDFIGINSLGLVSKENKTCFPKTCRLLLQQETFDKDVLILSPIHSKSLIFFNGILSVKFQFDGWPCFGLWGKNKSSFVCLEPWHGFADTEAHNGYLDLKDYPISLSPGEIKELHLTMNFKKDNN